MKELIRPVAISAFALLMCVSALSSQAYAVDVPLQLIGVTFPSTVPYDKPVNLEITLSHSSAATPNVAVYYTIFLNRTIQVGGWRFLPAEAVYSSTNNVTRLSIYTAEIPNKVYHDPWLFDSKIIYYIEAVDVKGNKLLSCGESTRWNGQLESDKYVTILTDTYPPEIGEVTQTPGEPTSADLVTVLANVIDKASGIREVTLHYSFNSGEYTRLTMTMEGDRYGAMIPKCAKGIAVTYHITAVDKEGNLGKSELRSYVVKPSPEELSAQEAEQRAQAEKMLYTTILAITILSIVVVVALRKRIKQLYARAKQPVVVEECKHPKAMTIAFLIILSATAILAYNLLSFSKLIPAATVGVMLVFWGLVDPRANTLVPFKRNRFYDENPPTALIAGGYVLLIIGAVLAFLKYLIEKLSFLYVFQSYAIYALFLVGLGVLLQLAWPHMKNLDISIEAVTEEEDSPTRK